VTRVAVAACPVCGGTAWDPLRTRSDGVEVRRCRGCGMGVVAERPEDLLGLYDDAYYGGAEAGSGYEEYQVVAAHSLPWAAQLVRLLQPAGKVLDVGAADGTLLSLLGDDYDRYAIEVNPELLDGLGRQGIRPLARDLFDDRALAPHHGTFDVVSAIAVLEHVADIRGALDRIRALLAPTGVLLFEVPLVGTGNDDVWFASSLEHVYYPTREGLRFVFEAVFGLPLIGREEVVQGFGSTFVGLATPHAARHAELRAAFARLLDGPVTALSAAERAFRFELDVVHSARPTTETLALMPGLPPSRVDAPLLARLAALWQGDRAAVGRLRADLAVEAERARELQGELAAERERSRAVREELGAIQTSRLWRAAVPYWRARMAARNATATLPVAARRGLRRLSWGVARALRVSPGGAAWPLARAAFRRLPMGDQAKDRWMRRLLGVGFAGRDDSTALRVPQDRLPRNQPLVTVVIPSYAYGEFIEETVDSVLAQTLTDVEILIVHSGSHEPTLEVLERLRRPRTTVLRREQRHLAGDNRNYGIARARGRYVCCLDSDDQLRPTYLEKAVFLLEERGYDVVSTSFRTFGEEPITHYVNLRPTLADMVVGNHVTTCAVFRKEWWERAGGYVDTGTGETHVHEDWRLFQRMVALGARVRNIVSEPLLRYRIHAASLSSALRSPEAREQQRLAIRTFNADVIDDAALRRSEELARLDVERIPPLANLAPRISRQGSQPTVLIALPQMVLGGAERLLSEIVRHLCQRGFRVVLATSVATDPSSGDTTSWFEASTAEIYHLPRFLEPAETKAFARYLVLTRRPDVLWIAGSALFYELLPELRARLPRLAVIDLLFNTIGHTASNRRLAEHIDLTICENVEVERWLLASGERPERVRRIESGVDLDRYRPAASDPDRRAALGIPADAFVVGFSGRFSQEKAPDVFLDLIERLADRERLYFVMSGAGPLLRLVEERLAAPGANPRVRFLGRVEDVRSALALYDALVLPSRIDGRPVVVLEALAMGVPVVATRVGALPQLVADGRTGFLCTPGATDELARRIVELAEDPELQRSMRAQARRFAEDELDAGRMLERYEATLRSFVRGPRGRRRRRVSGGLRAATEARAR
jgi:glycosyltransferase involved in cell wall biosynthesis/SAM-dependent methyltransferase